MATPALVTEQEFAELERELAGRNEPRLVRTRSMVHEFIGYLPVADPGQVRMSFFMYPRAQSSSRASGGDARAFRYGELGTLGSMAVELMMDGHAGSACSLMLAMKDKWPRLYRSVIGHEFRESPAGEEVKDSMIYYKIQAAIDKLEKQSLVTYVPPTALKGSYYSFTKENIGRIITLDRE
jgi:hypothetical protein